MWVSNWKVPILKTAREYLECHTGSVGEKEAIVMVYDMFHIAFSHCLFFPWGKLRVHDQINKAVNKFHLDLP